ncbi:hypothetical protein EYF80_004711 [Liparis tanakae]|uniref:Uncharacterized protein n=1 Tax=Liparis tanakae TaxID=230148 RepID=A0A4Z2J4W6_9TELE|nr:hypothetical protein EYF80_004711 [Liparis tanakae]
MDDEWTKECQSRPETEPLSRAVPLWPGQASWTDTKLALEIMSIHFVTLGYEQLCYFTAAVSL